MSRNSLTPAPEPESLRDETRAEAEVLVAKYTEGIEKEEKPQTA